MTFKADVFPEIPTPKNMLREMSKKMCFTGPFDRQHGKWDETLFPSERQQLYKIY